jgi:hypothetical protein
MNRRLAVIAGLILFVFWFLFYVSEAGAQAPIVPTPPPPPPPVTPTNPIDVSQAEAKQWDAVQQSAIWAAQSAANQAAAAAARASRAAAQAEAAAQMERAARLAAEQGLMNQAVESSHQAQLAAVEAVALGREATQSASLARQQSDLALRNVQRLKSDLADITRQRNDVQQTAATLAGDRAALAGALKAEQERSDLYGKVAIGSLALLSLVLIYMAFVLAKLVRALRLQPQDRMVVLDERGRVKAQIEGVQ